MKKLLAFLALVALCYSTSPEDKLYDNTNDVNCPRYFKNQVLLLVLLYIAQLLELITRMRLLDMQITVWLAH